jgi:hypothetical protein
MAMPMLGTGLGLPPDFNFVWVDGGVIDAMLRGRPLSRGTTGNTGQPLRLYQLADCAKEEIHHAVLPARNPALSFEPVSID